MLRTLILELFHAIISSPPHSDHTRHEILPTSLLSNNSFLLKNLRQAFWDSNAVYSEMAMTFLHHFCLCMIACDCIKMTMTSVSVIARWRMRGKGKMQSRSPGRVVPAVLACCSTNTCYNTAYTNTNTQRQKYKYKYTNTKAKGRSVAQCLNNICSTSVNTAIFCYNFTLHFNI